jgi:DNA-binding transcriptional MerR regulator
MVGLFEKKVDKASLRCYFLLTVAIDDRKLFKSGDVKSILGIKPEEAYLWSRTWGLFEPAIRGKAHGKNLYSPENLLEMAVIKELLLFGVNLAAIKEILGQPIAMELAGDHLLYKPFKEASILANIAAHRDKYLREGCVLLINRGPYIDMTPVGTAAGIHISLTPGEHKKPEAWVKTLSSAVDSLGLDHGPARDRAAVNFGSTLIIDLMGIVSSIELLTGKLSPFATRK